METDAWPTYGLSVETLSMLLCVVRAVEFSTFHLTTFKRNTRAFI